MRRLQERVAKAEEAMEAAVAERDRMAPQLQEALWKVRHLERKVKEVNRVLLSTSGSKRLSRGLLCRATGV